MTQSPPAPAPPPAATGGPPAPPPRGPRRSPVAATVRGTRQLLVFTLLAALTYLGYQVLRSRVAAEVYEKRLVQTTQELNQLSEQYNKAVTLTAVTELEVGPDGVQINVRTADGVVKQQPIEVDLTKEIYVDYVVKGGRLLMRRVFDAARAPDDAGLIDPALLGLDWNDPTLRHGQAIYRKLTPGRWIVSTSGTGAMALTQVEADARVELQAPEIAEYHPVEETARQVESIGPGDVLGRFFGTESP